MSSLRYISDCETFRSLASDGGRFLAVWPSYRGHDLVYVPGSRGLICLDDGYWRFYIFPYPQATNCESHLFDLPHIISLLSHDFHQSQNEQAWIVSQAERDALIDYLSPFCAQEYQRMTDLPLPLPLQHHRMFQWHYFNLRLRQRDDCRMTDDEDDDLWLVGVQSTPRMEDVEILVESRHGSTFIVLVRSDWTFNHAGLRFTNGHRLK